MNLFVFYFIENTISQKKINCALFLPCKNTLQNKTSACFVFSAKVHLMLLDFAMQNVKAMLKCLLGTFY